jgi:Skp family chaperone for outer membrane proteins
MKRILVFASAVVVLAVVSVSTSAQVRPDQGATPKSAPQQPISVPIISVPASKIAFVDTRTFGDEKLGITRYLDAVKSVQGEFQARNAELVNIQKRISGISDEIAKLNAATPVDAGAVRAKQDEGARLQRELKYKKEQNDSDFDKRFDEVVGPVSVDIGAALDQYATQHGLTMILDISKLLPAVLTVNPAMDITRAVIADYNSKHP